MMKTIRSIVLLLIAVVSMHVSDAFVPPSYNKVAFTTSLRMSEVAEERKTGVCKWFNTMKGFGFIVPDDGGPDIFVHQTAIKSEGFRSLADGESVEFTVEEVPDQPGRTRAIQVTGPGGANVQGAPFRPSTDYEGY